VQDFESSSASFLPSPPTCLVSTLSGMLRNQFSVCLFF